MQTTPVDKATLRRTMREQRKQLHPEQRLHEQNKVRQLLHSQLCDHPQGPFGFYLASGSELDLAAESSEWASTGSIFVPVLADTKLQFAPAQAPWRVTEYKTREPVSENRREVTELDLLLLPLLACDAHGMRLGQGGGWYDRTLSSVPRSKGRLPPLIGVGFEHQFVHTVPSEEHDQPLDLFLGANGWRIFTPRGEQWLTGS